MTTGPKPPVLPTGAMLDGIRVVDMSTVIFGPYATQMLAEMGADVIRIESPIPDPMRIAGRPARSRFMAAPHLTLNKGKRVITLDLKKSRDSEIMRQLLEGADVFIHNVRNKAIADLGFDYESVKAIRPDIIYVHCAGFGSGGPYGELQAYDDAIQAASGATTLAGRVDGDPAPRYLPMAFADKVSGLYGSQAILAALVHKLRTGRGQKVEVPMFESVTHFLLQEHLFNGTFAPSEGQKRLPLGYARQLDAARQPFRTRDGYICIIPYTDENLLTLLEEIGLLSITDEPRFSSPRERAINMSELYKIIASKTPERDTCQWLELLRTKRVPAMPVCDLDQIVDDPHLRSVGFFSEIEHPSEGAITQMSHPVRFSEKKKVALRPAPLPDQDREEILEMLHRERSQAKSL